jgi:hypothetical protein
MYFGIEWVVREHRYEVYTECESESSIHGRGASLFFSSLDKGDCPPQELEFRSNMYLGDSLLETTMDTISKLKPSSPSLTLDRMICHASKVPVVSVLAAINNGCGVFNG